jgi:hypothetical protein
MRSDPRVRCRDCEFAWYGATAAHGLRLVGSCPRCSGELEFLVVDDEPVAAASEHLTGVSPAAVLGTPLGWDR